MLVSESASGLLLRLSLWSLSLSAGLHEIDTTRPYQPFLKATMEVALERIHCSLLPLPSSQLHQLPLLGADVRLSLHRSLSFMHERPFDQGLEHRRSDFGLIAQVVLKSLQVL